MKKTAHEFSNCPFCGDQYEAYGAAGKAKHWKASHPAEWEEYKQQVVLPNLRQAVRAKIENAQAKKRHPRQEQDYMPKMLTGAPVEVRLLTKMDRLEAVVQKLQQRRMDIRLALLEVGDGFLSLATIRIEKG